MLIDRLLSLETGDLSNFRFTKYDFLIWPFVRIYIIENIYIKITSCSIPSAHREKLTFFENLSYLYKTLKYSPFNYSNYKIVFILTQIAATVKKIINMLIDYMIILLLNVQIMP